jgi:hypothetical protein
MDDINLDCIDFIYNLHYDFKLSVCLAWLIDW